MRRVGLPRAALLRWLRAPGPGDLDEADPTAWDRWLLRLFDPARILDVDGVLVDRRVLDRRFYCVADRCVGPGRGRHRSCCADVAVPVTRAERARLRTHRLLLWRHLWRHEPALRPWLDGRRGRAEVFVDDEGVLARPQRRCVFSRLDAGGAIRCRLRALAARHGLARGALQPLSCALFPLVLVETSPGRLLLSLVATDNHRLLGHHPPRCYPCLDAAGAPLLSASLRPDLELLLGAGFARHLATRAGAPAMRRRRGGRA